MTMPKIDVVVRKITEEMENIEEGQSPETDMYREGLRKSLNIIKQVYNSTLLF